MKTQQKRIWSVLLTLAIVLTLLPTIIIPGGGTAQAAELPDAEANKTAVLTDLGFGLTAPDETGSVPYGTDAIVPNPLHELFVAYGGNRTQGAGMYRQTYDAKKGSGALVSNPLYDSAYRVMNASDGVGAANRVAAGDFFGTGKQDHVAQVYIGEDGFLWLRVYDAKTGAEKDNLKLSARALPIPFDTEAVGSFLAVVTGDFNGDGKDEIAVYVPGNTWDICILGLNDDYSLYWLKYYPLWNHVHTTASSAPNDYLAVALAASDLDDDGKCDLLVTTSVHNNSANSSENNCYSRLFIYKNFSDTPSNNIELSFVGDKNYNLRYASATVAYVGNGKKIVVAGNYSVAGEWRLETAIASSGFSAIAMGFYGLDGSYGNYFSTYRDNFTDAVYRAFSFNPRPSSPLPIATLNKGYIFVNGLIYRYKSETNGFECIYAVNGNYPGPMASMTRYITDVAVGNFTADPNGNESVVFIQNFNNSEYLWTITTTTQAVYNTLEWHTRMSSVSNINASVAAVNIDDDSIILRYQQKRDYYFTDPKIIAVLQAAPYYAELDALDSGYSSGGSTAFGQSHGSGTTHSESASVSAGVVVGFEQEVSFFGLGKTGFDIETTLSASLGYEFEESKEKTYTVTFTSPGDVDRVALTTIPYVRYYYDILVPGYKLMSQSEYNGLKNEIYGLETWLKTTSITKTDEYKTKYAEYLSKVDTRNSVDDARAKGYGFGADIPAAWDTYTVSMPSTPRTRIMTVDAYDAVASKYGGMDTIRGNALLSTYQAGDPASYRMSTTGLEDVDAWVNPITGATSNWMGVATGGGTITQQIDTSNSRSDGITWGVDLQFSSKVKVGGVKAGIVAGASYEGGYSWVSTNGSSYSGTVNNMPLGAEDYDFQWQFFYHTAMLNGNPCYVLEYLTKDVNAPPSAPLDLEIKDYDSASVTLGWDTGSRPAESFIIYRYVAGAANPYIPLGVVDGTATEYKDINCKPDTNYTYVMQAVSGPRWSVYTNMVTVRTPTLIGIPKAEISGPAEVRAGNDANLTLKLTQSVQGAVSTSYAWQRKTVGSNTWSTVGTGASYKITGVTQAMDGYQYRCVVTQISGGEAPQGVSNVYTLKVGRSSSVTTLALSAESGDANTTVTDTTYENVSQQTAVTADAYEVYTSGAGQYYLREQTVDSYRYYPVTDAGDIAGIETAMAADATPTADEPDTAVTLNAPPASADPAWCDEIDLAVPVTPVMKSWVAIVTNSAVKSEPGTEITLTANVREDTLVAPISATGTVRFEIVNLSDSTSKKYIEVTLNGSGAASAAWTAPSAGVYQITAYYSGDANLLSSNSASAGYIAASIGSAATKALLLEGPDSIVYGNVLGSSLKVSLYSNGSATPLSSGYTAEIADTQGNAAASDLTTVIAPGVYMVTVSYADMDGTYTARHKLTVGKKAINIEAVNQEFSRNLVTVAAYSRAAEAGEAALADGSALVAGDTLNPEFFWVSCELLDIANTYPINLAYNTALTDASALTDFQSKYDVTFKRGTATVTEESYAVTYSAGDNGTIVAVYGDNNYQFTSGKLISSDKSVTFTVTPDAGFAVDKWTVNGQAQGETGNTLTFDSLTGTLDVSVTFARARYTVNYSVDGTGGEISAAAGKTPFVTGAKLVSGTALTFTATPEEGYIVEGWTVNGTAVSGAFGTSYALDNLTKNTEVKVKFRLEETYTVTAGISGNGYGTVALTLNGEALANGGEVPYGSTVTATITLDDTSLVNWWKVNGKTVAGADTLTINITGITENKTIEVGLDDILSSEPGAINQATVVFDNEPFVYNGDPIEPSVTVTLDGVTLREGIDYIISYGTNTDAGENAGGVTLEGRGRYTGTIIVTFDIEQATPTITSYPTASSVDSGSALSDSVLTGGAASVAGSFGWTDSAGTVNATGAFDVTFTPDDANYKAVTFKVNVTVKGGGGGLGGGGTNQYTVSFNSNGGSAVTAQTVTENGKVIKPADPTKDGYSFAGWYADSALKTEYDFNRAVTANITLYAKWTDATDIEPDPEPKDWDNPFTDIKESDWFYEDVGYVYDNGIFKGITATTFEPNTSVSRAMLVTMLWRVEGSPKAEGKSGFTDVKDGAWYAEAVTWAAENGIVLGIGKNLFDPDTKITREQMAAALFRYLTFKQVEYALPDVYVEFADESAISDYAKSAIQALNKLGIINGKGGNLIDPQGKATRAEAAAMLHRFMEMIETLKEDK